MTNTSQTVLPIFKRCVEAIREGILIKRVSQTPNPNAGAKRIFHAWRLNGSSATPAILRASQSISIEADADDVGDE